MIVLLAIVALVVWRWRSSSGERNGGRSSHADAGPPPNVASAAPRLPPVVVTAPSAVASAQSPSHFDWGGGDHDLGHLRREEGNAEGPMSLATDKKGDTLVLDQVNGRILRVGPDGKTLGTMKVPVTAAQDLAVADDGKIAVLDRLSDKTVSVLGPDGKPIGSLPLQGKGIAESGGVTGVFVDGDDVYAEYEHGSLVLLGDTNGNAAADRTSMPGRPSRDGKTIWSTGITDAGAGRLWLSAIDRATMQNRFTRELTVGMPVQTIVLLDTDLQGIAYLGVLVDPGEPSVLLACISPIDGHALGTVELPANTVPEESMRDLAVLDGGGVVYQHRTDAGVTLEHYDCR